VYGLSIFSKHPESSTVQINIGENRTKGKLEIANPNNLITLGTREAGRRQKKTNTKTNQSKK